MNSKLLGLSKFAISVKRWKGHLGDELKHRYLLTISQLSRLLLSSSTRMSTCTRLFWLKCQQKNIFSKMSTLHHWGEKPCFLDVKQESNAQLPQEIFCQWQHQMTCHWGSTFNFCQCLLLLDQLLFNCIFKVKCDSICHVQLQRMFQSSVQL